MNFTSTRNSTLCVSASEAILSGIAPGGGLFVPREFPRLSADACFGLTYAQTAQKILGLYLTDYSPEFLKSATEAAYSEANFEGKAGFLAPVAQGLSALELWHGPTCAFKDYALQLMPKLLVQAKKNLGDSRLTKILVATSGDTGKAALAGYQDLEGIRIAVFYPSDGTSEIQRLQMATQEGENVQVYAVRGNFDDAQTAVKRAFTDAALAEKLEAQGAHLSSANSINWGRLVPQIVYYYYTYAQLVAAGRLDNGAKLSFCVPTGNFGDILAGYYAMRMGLPVDKLICASNCNNVLTDFLRTGAYTAKRTFYKTTSPSMDILVSSNLERLLYHVSGSSAEVAEWMDRLNRDGAYTVPDDILHEIQQLFACGSAEEEQVFSELRRRFEEDHYLCDTHTAVAFAVARSAGCTPCVVLSTASPYKFPRAVLQALGKAAPMSDFEAMQALCAATAMPVPEKLAALQKKPVRFTSCIVPNAVSEMALQL